MSNVVRDVDECSRAIEAALAAMDPPMEAYEGILKLIAEFAQPHRECRLHHIVRETHILCWWHPAVRFSNESRSDAYFDVSDDGATATRLEPERAQTNYRFICASPSFNDGTFVAKASSADQIFPRHLEGSDLRLIGIHAASFRIDKTDFGRGTALGVAPASKVSATNDVWAVGSYMYSTSGSYWEKGRCRGSKIGAYGAVGDVVTVRLNLDALTVAFRLNGADVGSPQSISPDEAGYHFAFEAWSEGNAVTIGE